MANTKGRKPTKKTTKNSKPASKKSAPKKAAAKKPAAKRKRPLALSPERTHKLRRDQLAKWRYLDAEVRASVAEHNAKALELQAARRMFAEEVSKNPEVLAAQRNAESAKANLMASRDALVAKKKEHDEYVSEFIASMGLDPKGAYAIDDETGIVRKLEDKQEAG